MHTSSSPFNQTRLFPVHNSQAASFHFSSHFEACSCFWNPVPSPDTKVLWEWRGCPQANKTRQISVLVDSHTPRGLYIHGPAAMFGCGTRPHQAVTWPAATWAAVDQVAVTLQPCNYLLKLASGSSEIKRCHTHSHLSVTVPGLKHASGKKERKKNWKANGSNLFEKFGRHFEKDRADPSGPASKLQVYF